MQSKIYRNETKTKCNSWAWSRIRTTSHHIASLFGNVKLFGTAIYVKLMAYNAGKHSFFGLSVFVCLIIRWILSSIMWSVLRMYALIYFNGKRCWWDYFFFRLKVVFHNDNEIVLSRFAFHFCKKKKKKFSVICSPCWMNITLIRV